MSLEKQISQGIMDAMKAKDTVRLITLRSIKKHIIESKTAGVNIEELADADVMKIIQKLAKQGTDSSAIYIQQGREELAAEELAQVKVLKEFLPEQMSDTELTEAVKAIIADSGAVSMKDMGMVMGMASKKLKDLSEGARISAKVKELLS